MSYFSDTAQAELNKKKRLIFLLLAAVLLLGAWLRIDFNVSVDHKVSQDTKNYDMMVRQLLEKGVYGYEYKKPSGEPNARVTPGFPILMAAVYKMVDYKVNDPYPYIRFANVFMSLTMVYLMYLIGSMLSNRWGGLAAAFVGAIYPAFVWTTGAILTETMAACFLVLYVYLLLLGFRKNSSWLMAASGVALGITVLTRTEFLPIFILMHILILLWSRDWKKSLRFVIVAGLGLAITLSPWVIRNFVTFDKLIVSSTQVNPFAAGTYPNKNYDDGLVDRKDKTQMEVAKERLRIGFTEHTWTFVKWYTVGKIQYTYGRPFGGSGHTPWYPVIPNVLKMPFHLAIMAVGFVAMLYMLFRWRHQASALALIVASMSTLRLLFIPETRYNFTAMPLLIVMGSVFAVIVVQAVVNRGNKRETDKIKHKEETANENPAAAH
ncbi:ArnT family glycosyltransferase [Paenibacillus pasadenensis]|uniref:ArnT family glycosyltransferase n=1 Tax=Paenibacillus pasadenensis TaxID=217090 RepID=UPI00203BEA65|nr:phospholipid carrier-dependent glycosyltransferase [Paenibacillus pasadenensis]